MRLARLLVLWSCVGILPAAAWGQPALGASPYFSRQVLEASARGGDTASNWSLAWMNADQGSLDRAWSWVEALQAKDDEQAYFKAWLAWKTGRAEDALKTLALSGCRSSKCDAMSVNVYWDKNALREAAAFALEAYERPKTPQSYHLALLAALVAKDVPSFDLLERSRPWREEPSFAPWRSTIAGLLKTRSNM